MKLGQILLHRRKIGRDQLREALRRQQETGRPLGEILVRMGIVSRQEVVEALRLLPTGSIGRQALDRISPATAGLIPAELARRSGCLPVVQTGGALVVAMLDPLDARTVHAIEAHTGLPVIPIAAPADALSEAVERLYDAVASSGPGTPT